MSSTQKHSVTTSNVIPAKAQRNNQQRHPRAGGDLIRVSGMLKKQHIRYHDSVWKIPACAGMTSLRGDDVSARG
jgi:hypothetical protein